MANRFIVSLTNSSIKLTLLLLNVQQSNQPVDFLLCC